MTKILCAVKDLKAETFDGFQTFDNMQQAIRAFAISCERVETFKKWPEDYVFMKVAEINTETGIVTGLETPVLLEKATTYTAVNQHGEKKA